MENRKVAVLTGASMGIGKAFGEMLLKENYKVYGLCRSKPENENIIWLKCDLLDSKAIEECVERIRKENSTIDLLINNAGMGISGAIEYARKDDVERQIDINLKGAIALCQQVLPVMRKQRSGRIVFTSSLAAIFPIPYQAFYSVSKAGLTAFSDALSLEVGQFGLECCSLLLNDVKTEFTANRKKNLEGNEEYNGRIEVSVSKMEESESKGMAPKEIAAALQKLLKRKKLPAHYVVGLEGKLLNFLYHILPNGLMLRILGKIYG